MIVTYTSTGVAVAVGEAVRIVAPVKTPVTRDEATDQLRVTADQEVLTILRLINAATSYVEDYCGLGLITQTWEQRWSGWPDVFTLSRRPLQAVASVDDLTIGSPYTPVAASGYSVAGVGATRREGKIIRANGAVWPTGVGAYDEVTGLYGEAARVQYTVGFGDNPEDVPEMIRHAILMLITMWFDNRDTPDLGPVHAMLADWRPFGVA